MALRMHPYGCRRKAIWVVEVYDRGDSFSHRIREGFEPIKCGADERRRRGLDRAAP